MKLERLVGGAGDGGVNCTGGECPTVYRTDRDTFVVQGDLVSPDEVTELKVPSHEGLVEIPTSLARSLADKLTSER
ncbi:MAG: hypothetical protein ACYDDS_13460 [Candidatus Sulfotelmatobacter sp.]